MGGQHLNWVHLECGIDDRLEDGAEDEGDGEESVR